LNSADAITNPVRGFALFGLGFRPFFLFAATYSVFATLVWFAVYVLHLTPSLPGLSLPAWHAHEMIFGYGSAVVAGFLLTAAQNWTGLRTLHSTPLALLVLLWLTPRLAPFLWPSAPLRLLAFFDIAFMVFLIAATGRVVIKSGNKRQAIILLMLIALLLSNAGYYLALESAHLGLSYGSNLSGLYALVGLVLILSGRVLPFFTERGVGHPVQLISRPWVERASLILFLVFWISELADLGSAARAALSGALVALHSLRLAGWYTHGIWRRPLLWVLHVAYAFLVAGFFLTLVSSLIDVPGRLAIHAFAYGGVGMMTLGMMSRVSLGHTGRDVHRPPRILGAAFGVLFGGALVRVLAPLAAPSEYPLWIALSQVLWVAAFSMFLAALGRALIEPRVDGKPG
jgi:uncharacterized protein involved in response to NO